MIRTYSELSQLDTFQERFNYLKLYGNVGFETFGSDRYLNQRFYDSPEWKRARRDVIARDYGCDLGIRGFDIYDRVLVHHMNPINAGDIVHQSEDILDPEFLISVSHKTHNAIHYGDGSYITDLFIERSPGDTKLW